jgi:hypothetical protein
MAGFEGQSKAWHTSLEEKRRVVGSNLKPFSSENQN